MTTTNDTADESLQFGSPAHSRQVSGDIDVGTKDTAQWADEQSSDCVAPPPHLKIPSQPPSSVAFPKSPIEEQEEDDDDDDDTATHAALQPPWTQRVYGHTRAKSAPMDESFSSSKAALAPSSSSSSSPSSSSSEDEGTGEATHHGASTPTSAAAFISPRSAALSLTSLRNMASQWVPGSSRRTSPQHTPRLGGSAELATDANPAEAASALVSTAPSSSKQVVLATDSVSAHPVRLDRRRLDKAVSLAVEAAQAAEADERMRRDRAKRKRRKQRDARRRQKQKAAQEQHEQQERARQRTASLDHTFMGGALMARIRTISEYGTAYAYGDAAAKGKSASASTATSAAASRQPSPTRRQAASSRFNSLPWRGSRGGASTPTTPRGAVPFTPRSAEHSQDEDDRDRGVEGLGLTTGGHDDTRRPKTVSTSESDAQEDDVSDSDVEEQEDNFSVSLYLSSLSYLLSALPSKDAGHLPDRDKEELRKKLREVLNDIGGEEQQVKDKADDAANTLTEDQKEQRLRELLEEELRRAEARMLGHSRASPSQGDKKRKTSMAGASPSSYGGAYQTGQSTLVGTLASTALDVGFAVTAAGVGLLGTGLALLAPRFAGGGGDNKDDAVGGAHIVGEVPEDEKALTTTAPGARPQRKGSGKKKVSVTTTAPVPAHAAHPGGLQWDLAKALASSTASALYTSLSYAAAEAVQEQQQMDKVASKQRVTTPPPNDASAFFSSTTSTQLTVPTSTAATPEDRLISLTGSFVRALKRSPLPSQLSTLSSQVVSILASLDAKYHIRQRAIDQAVKGTRNGVRYVRKRGWHVLAVRGIWAVVEMSLEGVSVWREEGRGESEGEEQEEEEEEEEEEEQEPSTHTTAPPQRTPSWTSRIRATNRKQ